MDQFILFGDSLTQQAFSAEHGVFGPAISDAYIRRLDIVNRGFSGYNTSQALRVLPKFMPSPSQARVRFMIIFFGANDSRLPNTPLGPQQHVPLETYKENLKAIATHECVGAHPHVRLILVTPPPVDERKLMKADEEAFGQSTLRRTADTTAQYATAVREVGRELDIAVLDLWTEMMVRAGARGLRENPDTPNPNIPLPGSRYGPVNVPFQGFSRDGLHFSREGYRILFEELMGLIEKTWPDQMPDKLPFVYPAWDDDDAWRRGARVHTVLYKQ